MKVLIIDSNGMVGHVVALYMKEKGHNVVGYSNTATELFEYIKGEVYNVDFLQEVVANGNYDAVINCSAVINEQADEDKAKAVFVNSYIPHFLEQITANTNTVVVHRSTDCIFSGERGNYTLKDTPDAKSFYAKSKVLGEIVNEKDITIRTSLVGPEMKRNGSSLFNWYMQQSGDVKGFANAIWTGITTIEFAKVTEQLLMKKAHGLFQCVPESSISKYDLLCLFEKYFPKGRNVIKVENTYINKALLPEVGSYAVDISSYDTMISEMKTWVDEHLNLYMNY